MALKRIFTLLTLLLAALLILAACAGPTPELVPEVPADTIDPQTTYTAAVNTVLAELTRAAAVTPVPPDTAVPATLTPAAAAETPAPPADLPTPTQADTPVLTLVPTLPAAPADDPRPGLGTPTLHETFENPAGWSFTSDGHTQMDIDDGQLRMTALNADFWNGWAFHSSGGEDFYLEMTATHQACAGRDRFGLIFRSADYRSGYLLGLSCDGRYAIWTWDGAAENRFLDWTPSEHIQAGQGATNRLGVMARGERLAVYVNGFLLEEVTHSGYSDGRFGVFVGAAETPGYTAVVDELRFWELP
jgi:hypothetical protein